MGKFREELIESLKQAAERAKGGKVRGMRVIPALAEADSF